MAKVLNTNRYSTFRDPQDHLRMLNLLLDGKRLDEADNILGKLERSFGEASLNVLCRDLARSRMASAKATKNKPPPLRCLPTNTCNKSGWMRWANASMTTPCKT